jgi:16S rRNA (cytidine1402-2'-O)-methyltransferase
MLYMVATPIGNLSDMSSRSIDILNSVEYIACEDTRQTKKLLDRFKIKKKLTSIHEHSSLYKLEEIVEDLKAGIDIAYASDSGTPNLSDPGGRLVELAMQNNIPVSPIPGPSALTALISVAPFSCSDFRFIGFFPRKKGRLTLTKEIATAKSPIFFYESPKRIRKTLNLLKDALPGKKVLIGREVSKIHEQIMVLDLSLTNEDNINNIPERGEFVLAIFE